MSYIIPPRLKSSDYTKGAITQDEYLRVAAANDANISAARKAYKIGEVQQLTPIQSATPDELLGDIAKQEADARSNLLRLGFRDQEASRITADLMNEQDVLRTLNINFPAIQADVKKRFNPKLITPAFFLEYLREYNQTLNAARGLDVNSASAIKRPINALINNVAELRAIMPDPAVIEYIRNSAENQRFIGQDTIDRLDDLRRIVLGQQQLAVLGQQPPAVQYQFIQEITDLLRNIPTRAEVESLANFFRDELRGGTNIERKEIIDRINGLAAAVPNRALIQQALDAMRDANIPPTAPVLTEETPAERRARLAREQKVFEREEAKRVSDRAEAERRQRIEDFLAGRRATLPTEEERAEAVALGQSRRGVAISVSDLTGTTTESVQSLSSAISLDTATLQQIKATLRINPDIASKLINLATGEPVNYNDLALKPPSSARSRKVAWTDTNLRELFQEKFGRGIQKYTPLKRIKLGKGIAVQEQPTYREFGKYAIHIPQLEQEDILNVKYRSLGGVPKFKPFPVSDIFRDFMLDVLDGKRPSERVYLQIDPKERKAFEDIAIGAGVWNGLGLKRTTTNEDEEDRKRFEVLKGIYIAGNNSPQVSQELRRLVVKFINEGKMKRQQGLNLLMELSI